MIVVHMLPSITSKEMVLWSNKKRQWLSSPENFLENKFRGDKLRHLQKFRGAVGLKLTVESITLSPRPNSGGKTILRGAKRPILPA